VTRAEDPRRHGTAGDVTLAWFHCFSGIAGDMALASLLDAGADAEEVVGLLKRIPFGGWKLQLEPVLRGGIACTRAVVSSSDHTVVRTHAHIVGLLSEARLPPRVTSRSLDIFGALARVEARLHRRPVDRVHFHEVGGHDTIVDVVGTAAALEVLGIDEVAASPVATGTGTVRTAHGLLPNPSPAVVRLLEGAPTYGRETTVELTTPTGAAILAALARSFGPLPPMDIAASGFGAGSHELADLPNCTQVVVGLRRPAGIAEGQPVTLLETNLDDVTGEQLARTVSDLLDAGAHDAWVTPVLMKKGRPGHVLHVLCDPARASTIRRVVQAGTGTLGVRAVRAERWPSTRTTAEVEVAGQAVRLKVGPDRVKAEDDDVDRVSHLTGLGRHEISSRAEEAWRAATVRGPVEDDSEEPEPA